MITLNEVVAGYNYSYIVAIRYFDASMHFDIIPTFNHTGSYFLSNIVGYILQTKHLCISDHKGCCIDQSSASSEEMFGRLCVSSKGHVNHQ